ncbi:MAG: MFS transporter [Xenococcaceae cyanobacterium]
MKFLELRKRLSRLNGRQTFWWLWSSQSFSLIGSSLTRFALGVWLYQQTGAVTQYALFNFCAIFPILLLSPFAGVVVDRCNRRWVMLVSDTVAGISTLSFILLLAYHNLEVWYLYLLTAVGAATAAFQGPALTASITLLVPKKDLGRASGLSQLAPALAKLLSPVLGGVLLGLIQLQGIMVLDGLTFGCAVMTLALLRLPQSTPGKPQTTSIRSINRDLIYGWRYILERPSLVGLMLFFFIDNWLLGLLLSLVTPLGLIIGTPTQLGWALSLGGLGMVTGSLVMSRWGGPQKLMLGVLGFNGLMGLSMLIAGVRTVIPLLALSAFVFLFSLSLGKSCVQALLQRKVPVAVQGRVFAIKQIVALSPLLLAFTMAGPLADGLFEPWMATDGPLASSLGLLLGTGPGRGIGLMFCLLGILTLAVTGIAYQYPPLRYLDQKLPDALNEVKVWE